MDYPWISFRNFRSRSTRSDAAPSFGGKYKANRVVVTVLSRRELGVNHTLPERLMLEIRVSRIKADESAEQSAAARLRFGLF